ncbi:MAG TPA: bifunctional DNA-binding transcriptional regulator/O6-methylguanine-DNA methyltransferase Ada [Chloroflexota bacterium]|nr:bifunctional DNA-binding transcriptional regulator/O6-methylguanine-DNA methyltransferase Ada [Chloroflexota bacterium]
MPTAFSNDEARWLAVLRRDPTADGHFVYAVRTTGVYCRPSCPSRPARRENVSFHRTGADAERAGFRPCKRCRPNEVVPDARRAAAVAEACRLIETAEEPLSLDALAEAVGLSPAYFHKAFKFIVGVTPKAYADARRHRRVRDALPRTATVTEAIYGAGFNSSGRFYAASEEVLGMTPTDFRKGGPGETIRFAVGACSLGAILVAATDKGVCAIMLDDDPDALARHLQDRFPKANLVGADGDFERIVATVVGFVDTPARGQGDLWSLPLDARGTAFQHQVWQALRAIPLGQTATYAEIAERIGAPRAVRAVARACATNPVAIAIPCHRVVRRDGDLAGYHWGVERKKELLERESRT